MGICSTNRPQWFVQGFMKTAEKELKFQKLKVKLWTRAKCEIEESKRLGALAFKADSLAPTPTGVKHTCGQGTHAS